MSATLRPRHVRLKPVFPTRLDLTALAIPTLPSVGRPNLGRKKAGLSGSYETIDGATTLAITGMTCLSCVNAVTGVLSQVPGVTNIDVDLAAGRARVEGSASAQTLRTAVEKAGYRTALAEDAAIDETRHGRGGCC